MSETEKTFHSKHHVLYYVIPWKRRTLHFRCPLEKHDFGLKLLQCVTSIFQHITKSQIFCFKKNKASKFEVKHLQRFKLWTKKLKLVRKWKNFAFQKLPSDFCYSVTTTCFAFFCVPSNSMISKNQFYDASGFE